MSNFKWSLEKLQVEALKYKTRGEFQKLSRKAYDAAHDRGLLEQICKHMPKRISFKGENNPSFKWTLEKLIKEASKYCSKSDFQKGNASAYAIALRSDNKEIIFANFPTKVDLRGPNNPNYKWTDKSLLKEANKYKTRTEFFNKNPAAYGAATRRGILDKICSHMVIRSTTSSLEQELFSIIKDKFSNVKKLRVNQINWPEKPWIKGFEIDIFIPELKKGIEFDGSYHHSIKGLSRTRTKWPKEDIENYHHIKDQYFLSKGIQILHITEEEWLKNSKLCIKKCFKFLK